MKKLLVVLLSVSIFLCMPIYSSAASAELVYENVNTKAGEYFEVPVSIKKNPGIMGFGIYFDYDEDCFDVISVKRGSALKGGLLEDSIGTSKNGIIKILWTGTSDFTGNGELFVIKMHVKDDCDCPYTECTFEIDGDDTFNEKWQPVSFETPNLLCIGMFENVDNNPSIPSEPSNPYEKWTDIANQKTPFVSFLIKVFILPILYLIYEI